MRLSARHSQNRTESVHFCRYRSYPGVLWHIHLFIYIHISIRHLQLQSNKMKIKVVKWCTFLGKYSKSKNWYNTENNPPVLYHQSRRTISTTFSRNTFWELNYTHMYATWLCIQILAYMASLCRQQGIAGAKAYFSYLKTISIMYQWRKYIKWHHNGSGSVSNHQPHPFLLNRLFRRRSKKISKLRVTGLCSGDRIIPLSKPIEKYFNLNPKAWWDPKLKAPDSMIERPYMGILSTFLALCEWYPSVTGIFPSQSAGNGKLNVISIVSMI